MSKVSVYLNIPIIVRVIIIWGEVFFKLRLSFDILVIIKKLFSESSHHIETHIDVVVEVLGFHRSVSFDLCLDEEFIEFW